jgi:hypothetical protein
VNAPNLWDPLVVVARSRGCDDRSRRVRGSLRSIIPRAPLASLVELLGATVLVAITAKRRPLPERSPRAKTALPHKH